MSTIKKKSGNFISAVAVAVVLAILLAFLVTIINSKEYFISQLYTVGSQQAELSYEDGYSKLDDALNDLDGLALQLSDRGGDGVAAVAALGSALAEKHPYLGFMILDTDGWQIAEYGECGNLDLTKNQIGSYLSAGVAGNSPLYKDTVLDSLCFTVYRPISGTEGVRGIIAYMTLDTFAGHLISAPTSPAEGEERIPASYTAMVDSKGYKLAYKESAEFALDADINRLTSLYDQLESLAVDGEVTSEIQECLKNNGDDYCGRIMISGENYLLALLSVDGLDGYYTFHLFAEEDIYNGGFSYYRQFNLIAIGLCVVVLVLLIVCLFINYEKTHDRIVDRDPYLGCNTYVKFQRDAQELIRSNKFTKYAIIYLDTNRLTFIRERFGSENAEEFLRKMSGVIAQSTLRNESYGYVLEDNFVMLVHYDNKEEITRRLKLINIIINSLPVIKDNKYSLKLCAGVYCVEDAGVDLQDAIDRAVAAHRSHKENHNGVCVFFDSSTTSANLHQAEVESRMEYALKNGEFRIFLQPKYNIKTDRMDGAEVLVRWFNEEKNSYQSPAEFVPIFELNGFIVNMDHYVYEEACKFIDSARSLTTNTIRISVNVSRVTATAPDFLKFYLNTKRKYNIANGVITLEFTESFAFENYDAMKQIILTLKQNGINSSVDDFGSGFSSYNILKELPLDELKLDRFFIKQSANSKRDQALLSMMIKFCNDMGITVTQEGVETVEDTRRLAELGCDVIQGYVYSKPIMTSDFMDFIKKSTSFREITGVSYLDVPKPAEAKPAEAKPAEQKPTEAKPTEQKPAEAKPAEAKPTEAKPTEAKPTEQKPAEQKPTEQKPE